MQDLCSAALEFAEDTLKTGGHFICKFYQGSEDKQLEMELKKLFRTVHREKPESSRSVSVLSQSITVSYLTKLRNLRKRILLR
jgi:23S rRNA U2552 (ribose-2'-O)-methylase RlmE/FtsJ